MIFSPIYLLFLFPIKTAQFNSFHCETFCMCRMFFTGICNCLSNSNKVCMVSIHVAASLFVKMVMKDATPSTPAPISAIKRYKFICFANPTNHTLNFIWCRPYTVFDVFVVFITKCKKRRKTLYNRRSAYGSSFQLGFCCYCLYNCHLSKLVCLFTAYFWFVPLLNPWIVFRFN